MTNERPSQVLAATEADHGELIETLSLAFAADPVFDWFLRRGNLREEIIRRLFRSQVRRYAPHGHCYRTADGMGGTLWMPPLDAPDPPVSMNWRILRRQAAITGWLRLPRLRMLTRIAERHHPEEPHYYLYAIGVRPAAKGRGIGGNLLQDGVDRCDASGIPAYLENSNEKNLPFYQRYGFEVMSDSRLPFGGPPLWFMWRTPR